jgi:multidrug efflux pump subunit AcrA (membrane-fusion protein)
MKPKTLLLFLFIIAAGATAAWFAARHQAAPTAATAAAGRKILYYQSPMHPWIKSDKPGKCPICGMNLVPVYENGESTNTGFGLKLNSDSVNVANVQIATVQRRQLVHTLHVAGNISVNSWTEAWFEFDAYERDIPWLKIGQTIEVRVPGIPGKIFTAEIKLHGTRPYADQKFDSASDSTKVRAEISNGPVTLGDFGPRELFNALYAEGNVLAKTPEVLAVPRSAVLSPGAQPVIYADLGNGYYEQRKVKLGRVGDEFVEVLDGLKEGEKVVTSGGLLIDAEAQISQSANN